jgi:general stress protein 26
MSSNPLEVIEFVKRHLYAVQASTAGSGAPQAALIGFVANDDLELFFDTFESTRKAANLDRDRRVAFVIGGGAGDERTVQYEGIVDVPTGTELERFQQQYFAAFPDGLRRRGLPGIRYYRASPRWVRFSNFNQTPPLVAEFTGDAFTSWG